MGRDAQHIGMPGLVGGTYSGSQTAEGISTPWAPGTKHETGIYYYDGNYYYVQDDANSKSSSGSSGNQTAAVSSGGFSDADLAAMTYQANMQALQDAYSRRVAMLQDNMNTGLADLQRQHDYNQGVVNQNADRSLQDAYVNMMLNKRDLPQMLTAQGISGGLSETALAGIRGGYGSQRNNLELQRGDALTQLLNTLQNNQSALRQQYNTAMANDQWNIASAEMQIKQAFANSLANILAGQTTANQNTLDLNAYAALLNMAGMGTGNGDGSTANYYQQLLAMQNQAAAPTAQQLAAQGYSVADLRSLGLL